MERWSTRWQKNKEKDNKKKEGSVIKLGYFTVPVSFKTKIDSLYIIISELKAKIPDL